MGKTDIPDIVTRLRQLADMIEAKAIYIYSHDHDLKADIINSGDTGESYTFALTGRKSVTICIEWQEAVKSDAIKIEGDNYADYIVRMCELHTETVREL